jgi:hypothetical protein
VILLPFLCAYAGTLLAWHWHGESAWAAASKRSLPKAEWWGLCGGLFGWLVITAF